MIILDSTSKSLVAVLAGAVAANQPIFTVGYANTDGTIFTETSADGTLNGVTEVELVPAPAASNRRIIKWVTIYNADTAAVTVSVSLKNGASVRIIRKKTMAAGDSLLLGINEPLAASSLGLGSADFPTFAGLTVGSLAGIIKAAAGVLSATALGAANLKFFMNAAGAAPEWSKGIKLSVYTHDVSITGDQTLTGAGFLPTLARILFFIPDVLSGHGLGDGTLNYCVHYDAAYPNDAMSSSSQIIVAYTAAGQQFSAVLTFNADGGVLTWSKSGSPTGTCTVVVEWLR